MKAGSELTKWQEACTATPGRVEPDKYDTKFVSFVLSRGGQSVLFYKEGSLGPLMTMRNSVANLVGNAR